MPIPSITHTFYDFEIETVNPSPAGRGWREAPGEGTPGEDSLKEVHLVKILSVDGRRFTYEVRGPLNEEAVIYIKSLIDAVVYTDMVIEKTADGFEAREATGRLKKHS